MPFDKERGWEYLYTVFIFIYIKLFLFIYLFTYSTQLFVFILSAGPRKPEWPCYNFSWNSWPRGLLLHSILGERPATPAARRLAPLHAAPAPSVTLSCSQWMRCATSPRARLTAACLCAYDPSSAWPGRRWRRLQLTWSQDAFGTSSKTQKT